MTIFSLIYSYICMYIYIVLYYWIMNYILTFYFVNRKNNHIGPITIYEMLIFMP